MTVLTAGTTSTKVGQDAATLPTVLAWVGIATYTDTWPLVDLK
jgi:hypothetical protein